MAATDSPQAARVADGTALVIQECQRGVIGPDSMLPQLANAAAPALPFIARLAHGARRAGVPVVHSLVTTRADGHAEPRNAPLYRMAARAGKPLLAGTPAAEVAAAIEAAGFGACHVTDHPFLPRSGSAAGAITRWTARPPAGAAHRDLPWVCAAGGRRDRYENRSGKRDA